MKSLVTQNVGVQTWLITGVAGFIGSNLLEALLKSGQKVVGLDNFSTGSKKNLKDVCALVGSNNWNNFQFIEGDITELETCRNCLGKDIDYVLHQAALGSVPRSINDPITSNLVNVNGFINMLWAAKGSNVKKIVYAASSSTYGDHSALPKTEQIIGKPLSPYAVTKYVNELYADVFSEAYELKCVGLRYFNVFGPRQSPNGAYAAVVPKWIQSMLKNEDITINGDGTTSRDFTYIENVVNANILAALQPTEIGAQVCNIACGSSTTLNELFSLIKVELQRLSHDYTGLKNFAPFRAGDVKHSKASIDLAKKTFNYEPTVKIRDGIERTVNWHHNTKINWN